MPDEAVALDLYFPNTDNLESDSINEIRRIVSETEFQPDPHDESMMGGTINFQPFENCQENRNLLEKCIKKIENEFPGLKVSYEIKRNRDAGRLPAKQCVIKVVNQS